MDRTLTVRLPEALLERLNVAAVHEDRSRSSVVRRALEAALVRSESVSPRKGDHVPPEFVKDPRLAIEPSPPEKPSANYGSHERYGPRKPRGKPFQKS